MRKVGFIFIVVVALTASCKKKELTKVFQNQPISENALERVEPPHWWIGFEDTSLQLLIKEEGIAKATPSISYQGVVLDSFSKGDSENYLFIDLTIDPNTKAGKFDIVFEFADSIQKTHTYELKDRLREADEYQGFNSSDVVYLVTPDRFANGSPDNDVDSTLLEKTIDRSLDYARHGGDIQGIINQLDYIEKMGFTQLWSSPLLTNDMPQWSYHGYAMTDFYQVDPRFGTLEDYKELSSKAREKGIGLIMDQVANHCGLEHWWMKDLPFDDWINHQKLYEDHKDNWNWEVAKFSNHRRTTNQDTYAAEIDKKGNADGWFVPSMPDLNQRNSFMAKYIIQNSIWWIETLQLSGIRQDTYPYPDKDFMSSWAGAIMKEYPAFSIVGEEWSYNPLLIAYWQEGNHNKDGYGSNLTSTMDFAMQGKIAEALNEEESWDKGLVKMYESLANDFAYPSPKDIMIFADNHDMDRVFTRLKEDVVNTKMALGYMLVLPRIPQIYYGTEILMQNTAKPGDHGLIRTDMPGGWQGDGINAFTGEGLTSEEQQMQTFVRLLLNYRKNSSAIHEGKTIHFAPQDGIYVLARNLDNETVVCILNKNEKPIRLDLKRFRELELDGKELKNIISQEQFVWKESLPLQTKGIQLLTTKF